MTSSRLPGKVLMDIAGKPMLHHVIERTQRAATVEGVVVALGARVVEKHFTYRREGQSFGDHQLSLEPDELAQMVRLIREVEPLRGVADKPLQPGERPIRDVARRSLAVSRSLSRGERLVAADLTWLRPASGIPPGQEAEVVGRVVARDIGAGELLSWDDLAAEED